MVLSSQVARPDSLRRFSTSRRRRHPLRNGLIFVGLAAFVVWLFWSPGKPADTSAAPSTSASDRSAAAAGISPLAAAPADSTDTRAIISAEQRRLVEVAAEQEAFLSRLRGNTLPAIDKTPMPPSAADPAEIAKLFENARQEPLKREASSRDSSKSAKLGAAPFRSVEKPVLEKSPAASPSTSRQPAAVAPAPSAPSATSATGKDEPRIAAAVPNSPVPTTAAPSIPDMIGRLNLTTPAAPGSAGATLREGMSQIADGKLVEGRRTLSRVLTSGDPSVTAADAAAIRDTLASINKSLVFTDRTLENDTIAETYTIASGDLLSVVAKKYKITYQFIEQINNIDARRVRVGQKIKVIKGPFHAIVDKSDFRMDVFAKEADNTMIYITSLAVGVGKDDSTPIGSFIIKAGGKLENPSWTHPRTGKFYGSDDPENPIGEYWIALQGTDEHTKGVRGYGIHGTIEPASIGKQASLGCVRLLAKDIEQVYKLLADGQSTVVIQP